MANKTLPLVTEFLNRIIINNRITLSFVLGALFLYLATPRVKTVLIGTPFILLGEFIRTWASGYIKKNKELAHEGPYAHTRNPLYLGNFFIGIGFTLMANNILLWILFLITFYLIYSLTIQREEKRLLENFGEAFLVYKKRVPAFFPLHINPANPGVHFDWRMVVSHKEHQTWLGIIGCLIIFILKLSYFNLK